MIAENADIKAIKLAYNANLINSCNGLIIEYENEKNNDSYRIELIYDRDHKVSRVKKNGKKSFYCSQKGKKGLGDRSLWQPYHHLDLIHAKGLWILWHEGEKAADYARNLGLISVCIIGSGFKCPIIINNALLAISAFDIAGIIYLADNDDQGIKKANYIENIANEKYPELPFIVLPISQLFSNNCQCNKGDDFVEFWQGFSGNKNEGKIVKEHIESRVLNYQKEADINTDDNVDDNIDYHKREPEDLKKSLSVTSDIPVEEPWYEQCYLDLFSQDKLFSDDHNNLYIYNGKSYDKLERGKVNKKIHHYVNNYKVLVRDKNGEKLIKPYATPNNIPKGYNWITQKVWESTNDINQGGLPLGNGILDMEIIDDKAYPKLLPHSPERLFTFCSEVEYQPNADPKYANELLECLDEPYRTLFIESVATILGSKEIKNKWDRIKALILVGEGSNGKDTLREVISLLLGKTGITSCNLNHFKQADEGRAFSLARLAVNPKINWASENKALYLDAIQSLKQSITGDPIFIEAKGKDGTDIELQSLFIFNSNEDPSISGDAKAIQSRFQIIPFSKVYSLNPSVGELKANPRFKHDKQFLIKEVCPAFLNILIEAYQRVLERGIRYDLANEYSEAVMEKGNHLKRFCRDCGIQFSGNESDQISTKALFDLLQSWYLDEDIKEEDDDGKIIWNDDDYKFDKVVKAVTQVNKRFQKLFPKAKVKRDKHGRYLVGVKMVTANTNNSSPQKSSKILFKLGDSIKFKVGDDWYDGTIYSIDKDETYTCKYDIGGLSKNRKPHQIIKLN